MDRWKTGLLILAIASCCVGCDQVTKQVAERALQGKAPVEWFHSTVRLQYAENPGAFLSLGATLSETYRFWVFLSVPGMILCGVGLIAIFSASLRQHERVLLACLLGGGSGNLLDRALLDGFVRDFLNIGVGSLRTGVFNVADVLIMVGAIGLVLFSVFPRYRR